MEQPFMLLLGKGFFLALTLWFGYIMFVNTIRGNTIKWDGPVITFTSLVVFLILMGWLK